MDQFSSNHRTRIGRCSASLLRSAPIRGDEPASDKRTSPETVVHATGGTHWSTLFAADHWNIQPVLARSLHSFLVAGVCVARDARAGIVCEYALEADAHFRGAICNNHLP